MIILPAICCARRMFCRLFHHINAHKTSNKKAILTPNAIPILAPEERCAPQAGSPGIPQRPALSVKLAEDTEKQLVTRRDSSSHANVKGLGFWFVILTWILLCATAFHPQLLVLFLTKSFHWDSCNTIPYESHGPKQKSNSK